MALQITDINVGAVAGDNTGDPARVGGLVINANNGVLRTLREVLTADRTYFVRTDGNDSNTGLIDSADGAFLTIQKAVNVAAATLDFSGFAVTVQVRAGTYTTPVTLRRMVGQAVWSDFTIIGDNVTPSNVIISVTNGTCITADGGGIEGYIKGVKITNTVSGFGVIATNNAFVQAGNIDYGPIVWNQLRANTGGVIRNWENYSISGGAGVHLFTGESGIITSQNAAVTITGTPSFTAAFAQSDTAGNIVVSGATYSGAVTGTRYAASLNGVINTGGGGATFFPGDVAGFTQLGGQYN